MTSERDSGYVGLVVAKVVCCGGLLLLATGALSGFGGWLLDGGLIWLVLAGIALGGGLAWWRRQSRTTTETKEARGCSRVNLGPFSWFMCALIIAAIPSAVQGEESGTWTLPRLVQHALDNNKGLAAAKAGTDVAREDINIAKGQSLPQVNAVSSLLYVPLNERLLIERHGFRPTQANAGNNPFQETILNYGVRVTMPFYTGGRIQHEISVSEAAVAVSRARAELTRQELVFNVTSAYYTYLRLRAVITANEALVRSVEESRRIAATRVKIGRAAQIDVLRLDSRLSAVESQLTVAKNNLDRIAETMKALLALPPDYALRIDGTLIPDGTPWNREAARKTALSKRPDLLSLHREIDAQRERIGISKARAGPSVDASVFYGANTGEDKTTDDAKFLLRFSMPLYSGGILEARKRRDMKKLRVLEIKLQALERRALADVERTLIELSSTKSRLKVGTRAVAQAEESLRVENQKFKEGRGTSNDLLLAEEALLRAKTELAATVSDNRIAFAALRFATGELEAPSE